MARTIPQVISFGCAAILAWTQVLPAVAAEPAAAEEGDEGEVEADPEDEDESLTAESADDAEPEPEPDQAVDPGEMMARLALIPVAIDGVVDEGADERLLTNLRKGFARGAFGLVDQAIVASLAPDGCDKSCVNALRDEQAVDYAVQTRIKVDDRDYIVEVDLVATEDASVVASTSDRCDLCGLAEVGQLLEAQTAVLRRKLEDLVRGPPVIVVDTVPSGALIFIDNELVGTSPLERPMIEGEHIVRVMLDGYVADEREVNLVSGVRETLDLELKRTPETRKFRAIGWAALGLGIPTLGAGVTLLALHGRYSGDCNGMLTIYDADGNALTGTNPELEPLTCPTVFESRWGAGAALAGGAALLTTGILLLLRTRNRSRSKSAPTSSAKARIMPAGLGIVGRF